MGTQSTGQTQQQSAYPWVPSWLQGYFQQGSNQAQSAQANLPNLTNLYGQIPLLGVPGLTGTQQNLVNQFQGNIGPNQGYTAGQQNLASAYNMPAAFSQGKNALAGTFNPNQPYSQSVSGLESFLGTAGQPSTATNAALKEFQNLQAPEIMQQAALMGQGTSGAGLSALAQGQEQAMVPFLQQDLQNQLAASGQLGQMGLAEQGQQASIANQLANLGLSKQAQQAGIAGQQAQLGLGQQAQTQQQLVNALQAAGLPPSIAQQQAQALFNQQQQRQQFASGIQQGPIQLFKSLVGQLQNATSTTTNPKF
jgi:hypothetical protein